MSEHRHTVGGPDGGSSTLSAVRRLDGVSPNPWWRRSGLALLAVVVALGATGLLGVRSATTSGSGGGYTLTVTYPQVARAGLDVPWRARVHHAGGVTQSVTLAISSAYFRLYETQGFYPDADTATNDGRFVYLTFSKPPAGEDLVVEYDAYIQPAAQLGKSATVKVLVAGKEVAHTSLHTWLVP